MRAANNANKLIRNIQDGRRPGLDVAKDHARWNVRIILLWLQLRGGFQAVTLLCKCMR